MKMKIAAAQYNVDFLQEWRNYEAKTTRWVEEAAAENAQILLFPEYASLELASLFSRDIYSSLAKQLHALQSLLDDYLALHRALAIKHRIYVQPGTYPVHLDSGEYRNRAYLFAPDGSVEYQDKLQMTRFENEQWLITRGEGIKVFDTQYGKLGIATCYDSEFPHIARCQVEAGADLILVPSCTDTLAGYHRVRIGCQARALENQCYVVQSPLVGEAPWSEAIDVNIGAAAVYTPVDHGFPPDGVLACGKLNEPQWVYAEIDLAAARTIRDTGQVFNYRDWPKQFEVSTLLE